MSDNTLIFSFFTHKDKDEAGCPFLILIFQLMSDNRLGRFFFTHKKISEYFVFVTECTFLHLKFTHSMYLPLKNTHKNTLLLLEYTRTQSALTTRFYGKVPLCALKTGRTH